jgi:predicted DNA-binding transcriptional regulator AlpA
MKTTSHLKQPDAAAGNFKSATGATPLYGDKNTVAVMLGMSERTVSNFLAQGCPCLKIGSRRVRFEMAEVRAWLKQHYGSQRIGKIAGRKP